ncbi:MAG TPA: hypothetical protein VE029_02285 [Rhizobacter sp.]|nr:hypothetical protein [Rhizobacter sp.]
MPKNFKIAWPAVALLAMLCGPAASTAAVAAGDAAYPRSAAAFDRSAAWGTPESNSDFLAKVASQLSRSAADSAAQAMSHPLAAANDPDPFSDGFMIPRGRSDLALWNLCATVRAQQHAKFFDLIDNGAKTVLEIEHEQVSAVPLPGVMWLFVMGVLGMAGTRITGITGGAARREGAPSFGQTAAA